MVVRIVVAFCETIVKNNINCCCKIHAAGGGNIDSIATITDDIFPQTAIFGAKNIESSRDEQLRDGRRFQELGAPELFSIELRDMFKKVDRKDSRSPGKF